jgi:hypothetical protein
MLSDVGEQRAAPHLILARYFVMYQIPNSGIKRDKRTSMLRGGKTGGLGQ